MIIFFWNIFWIFKFWNYLERFGLAGRGVVWGLLDLFNFLFSFRVTSNFLKLVSWFWFLLELAFWFADNFDKINEIDSRRIFSALKLSPVSIFKVHLYSKSSRSNRFELKKNLSNFDGPKETSLTINGSSRSCGFSGVKFFIVSRRKSIWSVSVEFFRRNWSSRALSGISFRGRKLLGTESSK